LEQEQMDWIGGGGVDSSHIRQQLHFLKLLRRSEIPHASNATPAQQSVGGEGRWEGIWASCWAGF